ncbi:ubiquitin carboxyl-terminal hydrolase-domain-containing protein [Sparassis latifolia]|uniref:PAN2-PAN3 deadenylation complex catalytic subunit PAN2 n=1 Tax=Sparassis crispa TaxID=139825 RepID=A0A401GKH5_9APHY|nr:PAB-dependent poly(A)-specific ribonuclease subunit PAN2 [Sparassis crispa]GBE82668.1 PAB-dependent poly(A)-specific ribonuclease subunit PAN2 [Sparassis crispa]
MASTYRPLPPITHQRDVFPQPITALSFDPLSDTLWAGSDSGNVVAYYTSHGIRGVAFPVGGDLAVKDLIATEANVRAVGIASDGMGAWSKGGVNKWYYRSADPVTTFSNNAPSAPVFAASTATPELLIMNYQTGDVMRRSPAPSMLTHLLWSTSSGAVISGASDGTLRLHDPRDSMQRAENSVRAHLNGIQDLEAFDNFVFTIGLGTRQGRPHPDPLVKVYDIRILKPLSPLPFASGPAFINRVPKRSHCITITSSQGLINIVDASNPNVNEFYQLDTSSYITSAAVSPTGAYMAFGDAEGAVHLMTAASEEEHLPFNGFQGKDVEWVDTPEPLPQIEWTDSTPLSSIGVPYYDTHLLSSWTQDFVSTSVHYPPPAKIPQIILNTMKINDNVAYASLPKELRGRRNVVPSGIRRSEGRFRSGKSRRTPEPDTPDYQYNPDIIPKVYQQVEIEYSKFGVEDFDFGFYNRTEFSGLETHILNSYTNPVVQLMHYILPIRHLAKSHITTDCLREHCLLCELGFVMRMLEDARGTNCQASNFCKTVGVLAQMNNAIELMDYGRESAELNYSHMIQAFHRFLVDHLSSEGNSFPHNPQLVPLASPPSVFSPAPAPITQLLGVDAKNIITCTHCKAVREKENMNHIVDMVYPRKLASNDPAFATDFVSILRGSLLRKTTHKATCQSCKRLTNFESRRSIRTRDLPAILAVNAGVFNEESHKFWLDTRHQTFLKPTIELSGQLDGMDDPESVVYELRAMVIQVVPKDQHSHLVAIAKVPEAENSKKMESPWFIFNDFVVHNISETEALSFPANWKVPAIIYLERVDLRQQLNFSALPNTIDQSILCRDTSISTNRDMKLIKHECLRYDELPNPGTLVAIDAEFVSMQQEETEYRSDGTKKVLRPARLSLARVSVLRGDGPKEGVPFIDDHIHTSEVIVDYLTEFSGIKFGDLDPHLSRYTLTPLKVVYKKLRLLVDRGCVFVGHGLSKDFRIINIYVPPEQVLDTVDMYFLKSRQRRLSLRFLTWYVLKENIQTETHDSIEDALSALKLYKAFQDFESQGVLDEKLDELYREGRQYNFKPPLPTAAAIPATHASPPPLFAVPNVGLLQMPFGSGQFAAGGFTPHNFSPAPSPNPYMQQNWRYRQQGPLPGQ